MQLAATREDIMTSVAFTGYRSHKLPFHGDRNHPDMIRLRAVMKNEFDKLIQLGFRQFLTGGAEGSDLLAAEVILELKSEYPRTAKLSHWLCMPCFDHTKSWTEEDKERLAIIKENSFAFYVSDQPYYRGCMQVRNKYMVDTSRVLIAVYDGKPGGTRNTIEYAKTKNKKVVIINPTQLTRIELIQSYDDIELLLTGDNYKYWK